LPGLKGAIGTVNEEEEEGRGEVQDGHVEWQAWSEGGREERREGGMIILRKSMSCGKERRKERKLGKGGREGGEREGGRYLRLWRGGGGRPVGRLKRQRCSGGPKRNEGENEGGEEIKMMGGWVISFTFLLSLPPSLPPFLLSSLSP